MVTVVEMIAALLLGLVVGRLWEIRKQIIRAEDIGNHRRKADSRPVAQGAERQQLDDRSLIETLDREIRDLVMAAVSNHERRRNIAVRGLRPMPYAKSP
jgi:hypothetical protein